MLGSVKVSCLLTSGHIAVSVYSLTGEQMPLSCEFIRLVLFSIFQMRTWY